MATTITPLTEEKALEVQDILHSYCNGYIPVQELNHAANEIAKEPTEDKVLEMTTYLDQFDKEFVRLQTVNTKAITKNQVRFAMADVRKVLPVQEEDSEEQETPNVPGDPSEENPL